KYSVSAIITSVRQSNRLNVQHFVWMQVVFQHININQADAKEQPHQPGAPRPHVTRPGCRRSESASSSIAKLCAALSELRATNPSSAGYSRTASSSRGSLPGA